MKKKNQKNFCIAICMLIAFVMWTVAIRFIDVQAIGPQESSVGFATINKFVHNLTGVHMSLYTITDWLGLVPLVFIISSQPYAATFLFIFLVIKVLMLLKWQ